MTTVIQIRRCGEEYVRDMVWYNGEIKTIRTELEHGTAREAVETEHQNHCINRKQQEDPEQDNRPLQIAPHDLKTVLFHLPHATMEELEMLKVEPTEESSLLIPKMFQEFKYYGVHLFHEIIGEVKSQPGT